MQANFGSGLDGTWADYKYGFSAVNGGFWYGTEAIHQMTTLSSNSYSLCVEAEEVNGLFIAFVYQIFIMDSESDGYTYFTFGVAGSFDPLGPTNRQFKFTTKDQNNQECCCANQAIPGKGGWWYSCTTSYTHITIAMNGVGLAGFYYYKPLLGSVEYKYTKLIIKANP